MFSLSLCPFSCSCSCLSLFASDRPPAASLHPHPSPPWSLKTPLDLLGASQDQTPGAGTGVASCKFAIGSQGDCPQRVVSCRSVWSTNIVCRVFFCDWLKANIQAWSLPTGRGWVPFSSVLLQLHHCRNICKAVRTYTRCWVWDFAPGPGINMRLLEGSAEGVACRMSARLRIKRWISLPPNVSAVLRCIDWSSKQPCLPGVYRLGLETASSQSAA